MEPVIKDIIFHKNHLQILIRANIIFKRIADVVFRQETFERCSQNHSSFYYLAAIKKIKMSNDQ